MPIAALSAHYNVSFYYNSQKVGYYLKQKNAAIAWNAPPVVSSFTLNRGSVWTYPFYNAVLLPLNEQSVGYYQCSVSYNDPVNGSSSTIIEHMSSIWFVRNSAISLLSSNVILLLISMSVVHHNILVNWLVNTVKSKCFHFALHKHKIFIFNFYILYLFNVFNNIHWKLCIFCCVIFLYFFLISIIIKIFHSFRKKNH